MTTSIRGVLGLLLCLAVGCRSAGDPGTAADAVEAPNGTIEVTRVAGWPADPVELNQYGALAAFVASARDGSVYIGGEARTGLIAQVDSQGRLVRTIGGIGDGPGEYRFLQFLMVKEDSLVVQSAWKPFMVYGPGGGYVRSLRTDVGMMGTGRGLAMRGDTLVLAQDLDGPGTPGEPLHLLAPNGQVVRSFGSRGEPVPDRKADPFAMLREVMAESDSSFWVARRDRYVLELWHINGTLERVLAPTRDWFPTMAGSPGDPLEVRPPTSLVSIGRDAHGHIVVVMARAAADWKPEPRKPVDGTRPPVVDSRVLARQQSKFEWVIEVLDPETGTLLASTTQDHTFHHARYLVNGLVYGIDHDTSVPELWRITHHWKP